MTRTTEYRYRWKQFGEDETVKIPDRAVGVTTDFDRGRVKVRYLIPTDTDKEITE